MSDAPATFNGQELVDDAQLIPYMILFLTYVLNVKNQYKDSMDYQNLGATFSVLRSERLALGRKLGLSDGGQGFLGRLEQEAQVLLHLPGVAAAFLAAAIDYPPRQTGCPGSMAVFDLIAEKLTSPAPASSQTSDQYVI